MGVEIQNLTNSKINRVFVRKVVEGTLQIMLVKGKISVGVVFVSSARIKELNKKYRNINKPTDALSISYGETLGLEKYLGEILISMMEVHKHAEKNSTSAQKELAHVLVHGTLHLLGWKHEGSLKETDRMHAKEEEIMARVEMKNEK